MDGSVKTPETAAVGKIIKLGGELRLTLDPPTLRGWADGDPRLPEFPPEIGLDIAGLGNSVVIVADAHRDATSRHALSWPLPAVLRDGVSRQVRAFHMSSGVELEGSPLTLVGSPLQQAALPGPIAGLLWPDGLAGRRAAGLVFQAAEGLLVQATSPARSLRYEMLAEAPPYMAGEASLGQGGVGIQLGIRVVADAIAGSVTLRFRLPELRPDEPQAFHITAWLPESTEAHSQARFNLTLERRQEGVFHPIRRLRRGTVFRIASGHPVEFALSPEEVALTDAEGLWLALEAQSAKGISALLPCRGMPPLPEAPRFEDARLAQAFSAAVEFLRVHGEATAEAHSLLPDLWVAPPASEARGRVSAAGGAHPFTQIILSIYNGSEEVRQCLHALRASATGPMQVVMIDDGSRAHTAEMLRAEAAADPRFVLHRRDINRGYTKSINEGVLLTGAEWLVVLNSDTLVPMGWLDRLHAAARARPGTGMVGPLSNAATWQSLPAAKRPDGSWSTNDVIEPGHLARMQAILDQVSERAYPEFPILNGFCTMISRQVFDQIGLYDEDAFPMGYGEETDLCLRARRAGFRLTLADDCFVYHHKSLSFGSANRARLSRAGGLEMTNKHCGVIVPALERMMQDCAPLGRLRARLSDLANLLQPSLLLQGDPAAGGP